jgi:broad specificity phosphatase PhoE
MTLLFIRHAETDFAGRFCGHTDPPVNERGFAQISQLLERLRSEAIDVVYSSDLARAVTTAEAIAVPVVTLPALREIYFGEWEGLSWPEIEARDAVYARQWSDNFPRLAAPGGESFASFESRVLSQIAVLRQETLHHCAAVVTHAGVMRVVLRSLCGLGEAEAWHQTKPYCSMVRLCV